MKRMESRWELIQSADYPGHWHVEYISSTSGEVAVTVFSGLEAKERAEEYCKWKNGEL